MSDRFRRLCQGNQFCPYFNTSRTSYICDIDWKLNNDINRPYKRSRKIRIVISGVALDDYKENTVDKQRFQKLIENRYKNFNPNHGASRANQAPIEEWLITTELLNG